MPKPKWNGFSRRTDACPHRFAGPGGVNAFLDACVVDCVPFSDRLAAGEVAGPCATYPGTETWCDRPFGHGAVLVGDAAGHNNPVIGQGLSIAMRLAADIIGAVYSEDTDNRSARHARLGELQGSDERMFSVVASIHGGPEVFPGEVFDPELLDLVRV